MILFLNILRSLKETGDGSLSPAMMMLVLTFVPDYYCALNVTVFVIPFFSRSFLYSVSFFFGQVTTARA